MYNFTKIEYSSRTEFKYMYLDENFVVTIGGYIDILSIYNYTYIYIRYRLCTMCDRLTINMGSLI